MIYSLQFTVYIGVYFVLCLGGPDELSGGQASVNGRSTDNC
jgi:hypothetical protein